MDEHAKMADAIKTLEANKDDFHNWKLAADKAHKMGDPLPAPPPSIAGAVSTVGTTLGNVALGVGSTAADVVGVAGVTVDALHGGVNEFFSNLRKRLGV